VSEKYGNNKVKGEMTSNDPNPTPSTLFQFLHNHQAISNKWVIFPECIHVEDYVIPKVKVKRKWPPTIIESSSMLSPERDRAGITDGCFSG
jgi:hypothetical protein